MQTTLLGEQVIVASQIKVILKLEALWGVREVWKKAKSGACYPGTWLPVA